MISQDLAEIPSWKSIVTEIDNLTITSDKFVRGYRKRLDFPRAEIKYGDLEFQRYMGSLYVPLTEELEEGLSVIEPQDHLDKELFVGVTRNDKRLLRTSKSIKFSVVELSRPIPEFMKIDSSDRHVSVAEELPIRNTIVRDTEFDCMPPGSKICINGLVKAIQTGIERTYKPDGKSKPKLQTYENWV